MEIPTVSTNGIRTSQTFYANGTSSPPNHTVVRKSRTSGSAAAIRKGDHKKPNPWSFNVAESVSLSGLIRTTNPTSSNSTTGVLEASSGIDSSDFNPLITAASNAAHAACIEDFYSQLSGKSDLASSAAEGGIKSGTQRMLQSADDVRRQAGTYGVRSIGRAWLAARYMWLPICGDIYNVVSAATGNMTRNGFKVKARGQQRLSFNQVTTTVRGAGFRFVPNGDVTYRVRMDARFVVNPTLDMVAQLTSLDPAVIAWNALPYSFVVDWFYNVGGYLANLEAAARYKSAFKATSGFRSDSYKVNAQISYSGGSYNASNVHGDFASSFVQKSCVRTVLTSIPLPRAPSLNVSLGSGTMLNAAALLASKLKNI